MLRINFFTPSLFPRQIPLTITNPHRTRIDRTKTFKTENLEKPNELKNKNNVKNKEMIKASTQIYTESKEVLNRLISKYFGKFEKTSSSILMDKESKNSTLDISAKLEKLLSNKKNEK